MSSNLKLLTFVGLRDYERVTYVHEGRECETELFAEALQQWFQPTEIIALLTPKARDSQNWSKLKARVPRIQALDIPDGNSETELWEIFSQMTKCLTTEDQVIFDITHAFRSLPVLALLSASFLRVAKAVNLKAVLYGAHDAKNDQNQAPVFDLTPFVSLLDWITATDKFIKSGDSRELACILSKTQKTLWTRPRQQDNTMLPRRFQGLSRALTELSQALSLARPQEISRLSHGLQEKIGQAAEESEKWAKPFTLLLDQAANEFRPFEQNTLASQRQLASWYVDHNQIMQAITLSREWLVSWTGHQINVTNFKDRQLIEDAINQASRRRRGKEIEQESPFLPQVEALTNCQGLLSLWDKIGDLRNDVAHCAMRENPRDVASIIKAAREVVNALHTLEAEQIEPPYRSIVMLLNTSALTAFGSYRYESLSVEAARELVGGGFNSAIGHASAASVLSDLLGVTVPVNRTEYQQQVGERAIVFKLKRRLPQGMVLTADEILQSDFELGLLTRTE